MANPNIAEVSCICCEQLCPHWRVTVLPDDGTEESPRDHLDHLDHDYDHGPADAHSWGMRLSQMSRCRLATGRPKGRLDETDND